MAYPDDPEMGRILLIYLMDQFFTIYKVSASWKQMIMFPIEHSKAENQHRPNVYHSSIFFIGIEAWK